MIAGRARAAWLGSILVCALGAGCDRTKEGSNFDENVERAIGDPQKSQGIFGGNSGPDEADAACCTVATDAGANELADARGDDDTM